MYELEFWEGISLIIFEIQLRREQPQVELGQVKGVVAFSALYIEDRALPLLDSIQALDLGKDRVRPGCHADRTTRHHHFGVTTWDSLFVEVEVFGPGLDCRPEAEIAFCEGGEGG